MKKKIIIILLSVFTTQILLAQTANEIVKKVRTVLTKVNDYYATGIMSTNVPFLKLPSAEVEIFFSQPDQIKIKSQKGVAFTPKGAMSINLAKMVANDNITVLDMGTKDGLRVVKLIPNDENSDIAMSTLSIDPINFVIKKAKTLTNENKSVELEMTYTNFIRFGLPSTVSFTFSIDDYKLPKGVTFDFDDGKAPKNVPKDKKNQKGKADIKFTYYSVNNGEGLVP